MTRQSGGLIVHLGRFGMFNSSEAHPSIVSFFNASALGAGSCTLGAAVATPVHAATAQWVGGTDASRPTGANRDTASAPGDKLGASSTTAGDAVFNGTNHLLIEPDAGIPVGSSFSACRRASMTVLQDQAYTGNTAVGNGFIVNTGDQGVAITKRQNISTNRRLNICMVTSPGRALK